MHAYEPLRPQPAPRYTTYHLVRPPALSGIPGMRVAQERPAGPSATPIYDALYEEYRRLFRALPGDRSGEEELRFEGFGDAGGHPGDGHAPYEWRAAYAVEPGHHEHAVHPGVPGHAAHLEPAPFPGYPGRQAPAALPPGGTGFSPQDFTPLGG